MFEQVLARRRSRPHSTAGDRGESAPCAGSAGGRGTCLGCALRETTCAQAGPAAASRAPR